MSNQMNWHIELVSSSSKWKDKHLHKIKEQVRDTCSDFGIGLIDSMIEGLSVEKKTLVWNAEGYNPVGFKVFLNCFEFMYDELDVEWDSTHIREEIFTDVEGEESPMTNVWWTIVMGKFTGQKRFLKLDEYGWDFTSLRIDLGDIPVPENSETWSAELIHHLIDFNGYEQGVVDNDSLILPRIIAGHSACDQKLKKALVEHIGWHSARMWTPQLKLDYSLFVFAWVALGMYKKGLDAEVIAIALERNLDDENTIRQSLAWAFEDRIIDENYLFKVYNSISYDLIEHLAENMNLSSQYFEVLEKIGALSNPAGDRTKHWISVNEKRVQDHRVQRNPAVDDFCTIHFAISTETSKKKLISSLEFLKKHIKTQLVPVGCEAIDSGNLYSNGDVLEPLDRFVSFIKAHVNDEYGDCFLFDDLGIYAVQSTSLADLEEQNLGFPQSFILEHSSGSVENIVVRLNLPGTYGSELNFSDEGNGIFVATYDVSGEYFEHNL